jgi:hypothetical protein
MIGSERISAIGSPTHLPFRFVWRRQSMSDTPIEIAKSLKPY